MNYYPFHIGDYVSATRHLSWDEDAAYRRLLDAYYTREGALPADLRAVCRLVLATTDAQREAVRVVLEEFFQQTPEGWVNTRAEAELVAMRDKQQKQRDKAAKRWDKEKQERGNAAPDNAAMPRHAEGDATASKTDAVAMPPTPTPTPIEEPIGSSVLVASRRRTRLTDDFEPSEAGRAKAQERGINADEELQRFRDYHTAKGTLMADWQAAWRTWIGNARPTRAAVIPLATAGPARTRAELISGAASAIFDGAQHV